MKQVRTVLLLVALSAPFSPTLSQDHNAAIQHIRQKTAMINTTHFDLIKKIDDPEEFLGHWTDNGAELTGYFKNDTIHKISESVGQSYGFVDIDYYFENGDLIFAYLVEKHFGLNQKSGAVIQDKQSTAFEGRYYYSGKRLIRRIESGKKMTFTDDDFAVWAVAESKNYANLLKRKK